MNVSFTQNNEKSIEEQEELNKLLKQNLEQPNKLELKENNISTKYPTQNIIEKTINNPIPKRNEKIQSENSNNEKLSQVFEI